MHIPHKRLAAYVRAGLHGTRSEAEFPDLMAHVQVCDTCRAELNRLLEQTPHELVQDERALSEARIDSSTSSMNHTTPQLTKESWGHMEHGSLVLELSEVLRTVPHYVGQTRALRGQLLWRGVREPTVAQNMHVTIEVCADETRQGIGSIRVDIDVPSRDPLDQAGSHVTLRADDFVQRHETDELGSVTFSSVPLELIRQLRIEIAPSLSL
jgi:hypothetical protein